MSNRTLDREGGFTARGGPASSDGAFHVGMATLKGEHERVAPMQLRLALPDPQVGQEDGSAVCPLCRRGRLRLVSEKPHPIYGTLGVTECTLRCDAPDCGKVVIEP